ncbi:ATP-binding protein [Sinorhizobium meliloti]|nr:ATP-binding protein [Sinorhizobium meliloti]MQW30727.1 AAA family ATPase [Sinorhizobium meliloti]MQX42510.1 AAA family ATPase [Sinorhizobium meliloti]RVE94176.1 ATP-binding protein [Sinorhizobium meliloti]RVG79061.1 ATP-binding protein [Sinorhizobium meliloti]
MPGGVEAPRPIGTQGYSAPRTSWHRQNPCRPLYCCQPVRAQHSSGHGWADAEYGGILRTGSYPAAMIMVIEDVDLVGRSRDDISGQKAETRLNRLLNEMDGLGEDLDILIIMTTNRVNSLEGALAARAGRVDVVLEIPLPDDDCRERLIERYGHALNFQGEALAEAVARSKGDSAAHLKEMVRRLAQRTIARGGSPVISREDVEVVFSPDEAVLCPLKGHEETLRRHIIEQEDEDDSGCC